MPPTGSRDPGGTRITRLTHNVSCYLDQRWGGSGGHTHRGIAPEYLFRNAASLSRSSSPTLTSLWRWGRGDKGSEATGRERISLRFHLFAFLLTLARGGGDARHTFRPLFSCLFFAVFRRCSRCSRRLTLAALSANSPRKAGRPSVSADTALPE